MKKKIINGLLFAVALVAATSSFVSCKDNNGDNYAELQEKYLTMQAAFDKQVAAMQDYVLTSKYNQEVGANYDVNKGTIKQRLDDIEAELDPTNPNSLAEQVHKNNEAILSLGDTLEHFVFMWGDDLKSAYENAGKAKQIALSYYTDTAKINQAIKDAQAVADKAWNYVNQGLAKDKDDNTKEDFQAWVKYFEDADAALAEDIAALKQDVENILKLVQQQVTGIEIQATYNPVFGTFSSPVDIQTNILAAYYGVAKGNVIFPAGDNGSESSMWASGVPAVLSSELDAIGAGKTSDIVVSYAADETLMIVDTEGKGNAGRIYLTVNPSDFNFAGKEFTLRASDNSVSKVVLSDLKPCDEQLLWGWKRAQVTENSANGFYVAEAKIDKSVVDDVALSFNTKAIASDLQEIMQDWSKARPSDIAKIAMALRDAITAKVPRLGVQAQWKDTLGWKNYVSKYEIAAFTLKPIGYGEFNGMDFSPAIVKFQNKLTAKEKAIATEVINKIAQLLAFELNLDPTTGVGDVEIDAGGNVSIVVDLADQNITIPAGAFGTTPASDVTLEVHDKKIDITPLINAIKKAIDAKLAQVNSDASGAITKVLNKVIDIENTVFDKVISAAQNPGRFIQPALIARCNQLGYFYPSRVHTAPTQVQQGAKIAFYPTTLTAELVAPAFMKYVAVVGAWNVDNMSEDKPALVKLLNSENKDLNTVFNGAQYNAEKPFVFDTSNVEPGTVLEFIYEALGYDGKIAGKKYYIEVYK